MAHFNRVWPTGIADGVPAGGPDLTTVDLNASKAVNGDEGGTWAPTTSIILGGKGAQFASVDADNKITGKLNVATGGQLVVNGGDVLFKSGYPKIDPAHAGSQRLDAHLFMESWAPIGDSNEWAAGVNGALFPRSFSTGTLRALQCGIPPRRGATILQVIAYFRPDPAHVALPATMPTFSVNRWSLNGTAVQLRSAGSVPWTATLAEWNDGTFRYAHYVCDQNNVCDDNAAFSIFLGHETGANSLAGAFLGYEITWAVSDIR
jgi:hypothetical protein